MYQERCEGEASHEGIVPGPVAVRQLVHGPWFSDDPRSSHLAILSVFQTSFAVFLPRQTLPVGFSFPASFFLRFGVLVAGELFFKNVK